MNLTDVAKQEGLDKDIALDILTKCIPHNKSLSIFTETFMVEDIPGVFAEKLINAYNNSQVNLKTGSVISVPEFETEIAHKNIVIKENKINFNDKSILTYSGEILDFLDPSDVIQENPELAKGVVTTILGIIALIEPTPALEFITWIIGMIPADVVAKIVNIIMLARPNSTTQLNHEYNLYKKAKESREEKLNELFDLDLNVSDLVKVDGGTGNSVPFLGGTSNIDTNESIESDDEQIEEDVDFEDDSYADYDDDYDFDDVEEDRLHSSLYGGDRTYCSCGRRLIRDEWGGYCPVCDAEEEEIDRMYHDADEEELRRMGAFDNMYDDEFEYDDNI